MKSIFPSTFERVWPGYERMVQVFLDAKESGLDKELIKQLESTGLSSNADAGKNLLRHLMAEAWSKNPRSEKASRIAMSNGIVVRRNSANGARSYFRPLRIRLTPRLAKLYKYQVFEGVSSMLCVETNGSVLLKNHFGKNTTIVDVGQTNCLVAGEKSQAVYRARTFVVRDHFMQRFSERVVPEENLTRYSEKERAFADFMLHGKKYWGRLQRIARIEDNRSHAFVEARWIESLPVVYFFGHGTTVKRLKGQISVMSYGSLVTCLTYDGLSSTKKKDMQAFGMTPDTWDNFPEGFRSENWYRMPNEIITSEGTPYGRR